MKVSFLGDIHGKWELIPKGMPYPIIQVGDLGIGFKIHIIGKGIVPDPEHFTDNFFFIRGNHDNPEECGFRPECLGDYGSTVFTNNKGEHTTPVFYVAGGFSVDRNLRVQGLDWWPEEELTISELDNMLTMYEKVKPKIVVSHEAPVPIVKKNGIYRHLDQYKPSRTPQALDAMLDIHCPERYIFGHHHRHMGFKINNTHFIGLDEGELLHLDI